ncbi:MAG: SapC family protein [Comamonadaceae bacterium]|nr:SapC family protein [Comamonadaceae bacterium]
MPPARHWCPSSRPEASRAAGSLPLAFWKRQDSFELVAVTGLEPHRSLMVASNGQWLAGYVPAVLRAHPFWLVRNSRPETPRPVRR